MDLARNARRLGDLFRISERIQKLPKRAQGIWIKHSVLIQSLALLIASGTLGVLAYQTSRQEALSEWEKSHFPSAKSWDFALGSRGFHALTDPARIHSAIRDLVAPEDSGSSPAVQADLDGGWVAIPSADGLDPARIYCFHCDHAPHWRVFKNGWAGFEEILSMIDAKNQAAPSKRAQIPRRDPREIVY